MSDVLELSSVPGVAIPGMAVPGDSTPLSYPLAATGTILQPAQTISGTGTVTGQQTVIAGGILRSHRDPPRKKKAPKRLHAVAHLTNSSQEITATGQLRQEGRLWLYNPAQEARGSIDKTFPEEEEAMMMAIELLLN